MNAIVKLNRREILKSGALIGGGLVLACYFSVPTPARAGENEEMPFAPNAFLRIGNDGSVLFIDNKSEMGQGVYTSLPMILAEELDCDWQKVSVEPAPVAPAYNHTTFGSQVTGGSTSVRTEWERLALAGATARAMLVQAAARDWNISPEACHTENGQVIHPDGRKIGYGALTDKAAKLDVPVKVQLKSPSRYTLIGKPIHRLDSPAKISGEAIFGIDVVVPDMAVAVIARPPVFGATVKSFNDDKAKAVPGVHKVVSVPAGVAVVADGFWAALQGREALQVVWDEGEGAKLSSESLRNEFRTLSRTPGKPARKLGDVTTALAHSDKTLSADYEVPYLAHAPMEPLNCCVDLHADSCDIHTGTQMQTGDRNAAATVLGLPQEKVRVHTTFLGGGFGRRGNPHSDFVVEAAQVAKAIGGPVKVIRTREDDTRAGYYRPCFHNRLVAGLDAKGGITAWHHTIVGQSIMAGTPFEGMIKEGIDPSSVEGAAEIPYAIANIGIDLHSPVLPVTVQWWRSVGHSHTAFAVEGFLDEIAHATGTDPVQLRRSLLRNHPRRRQVLDLATKKAGWGKPLPDGHGHGVAVHASFGSYAAQVAEVSVGKNGTVRVHRVVCAFDCGRIVNPDTIAAQIESAIVFGLTATLYGEITLKDGRVQQGNFDTYPLLTLDETPVIEVHLVQSDKSPGGVGEPGVPPVAPAVANGLFAASGARIRSLPMLPQKVLEARKKA